MIHDRPEHERNIELGINVYVTTKVSLWDAIKLRLAGAAYISEMVRQRIAEGFPHEKERDAETKDENWHCERCGEIVEPRNVTFEETHMNCGGRCV